MTVADLLELLKQTDEADREVVVRLDIGDGSVYIDVIDVVFDERNKRVIVRTAPD
jgi:hypothetical protein